MDLEEPVALSKRSGGKNRSAASGPVKTPVLLRLRRPAQTAVLALFIALPRFNASGWTEIYGSLFALDVYGLPLADPLSALQSLLVGGGFAPRLWVGAGIALSAAFLLGRAFCGWLCPYGLFSEQMHTLRRMLRPKNAAPVAADAWAGQEDATLRTLKTSYVFYSRAAICVCGIAAAVFLDIPVLQRFSLPGELSLAPLRAAEGWAPLLDALIFPVAILFAEGLSGERLWCRFICPQSVCLGLAARCAPKKFGVYRTDTRCTCRKNDRPCLDACSLRLEPRKKGGPSVVECMQCGDCVCACARRGGVLRIGLHSRA